MKTCVLLLALIQPTFALKMQNAATKSDPVWDESGTNSWTCGSNGYCHRARGAKASNAPINAGERKRFAITVPACAGGWTAFPLQLGICLADFDPTTAGDHSHVTKNSVWDVAYRDYPYALMTYTYHHMLPNDLKIHERTDNWSGPGQTIYMDVDMINYKIRWVSDKFTDNYDESAIPSEWTTVYPVVFNPGGSCTYEIANYLGDGSEIEYLEFYDAAAAARAAGDPHVTNIRGESFNINRMGYAPMVSITSEGTAHLEVMALIEGIKKCHKKMFITRINSSGAWLEKNVAVEVGNQKNGVAFTVTVDGQEVWSPAMLGYQPPTTKNTVFNHADKFSINEVAAKSTPVDQPGIELKTAHDVKMKIMRPLRHSSAPPHLNIDIQGIQSLPASLKVGGLLGNDDHSHWSTRNEECINFAQTFGDAESSRAFAN